MTVNHNLDSRLARQDKTTDPVIVYIQTLVVCSHDRFKNWDNRLGPRTKMKWPAPRTSTQAIGDPGSLNRCFNVGSH